MPTPAGTMLELASAHRIWLGRSREMAEIEVGLAELRDGRGSLFVVTGEPGIGKTRLADEVGRLAARHGVSVHWGRAWEAGGAPPYWPLRQALRSMASDVAALDALVTPTETPIERFQLFEAVDAFLAAATREPRVMILDDLHAADPSSLELLHFVVRDLRSRPLMVIATHRDAEARLTPEIRPLLARIAREARVLPLRRLERSEVAEFVAQATGAEPAVDRVDGLYLETEGNPLFLRELLQLHGPHAARAEGIREVVRARLSLMPAASRVVLEAAAVLGREFSIGPVAAIAGLSELDARARIEPAANAGIVEALDEPPRWRFTHVLLRQGLYEDLSFERRSALHHAAALELRRRPGGPELAELAHHLLHAIPAVSAVEAARAAIEAADRALRLLAFEDALSFYRSAETLLEGVDGEEPSRVDALLGAGVAWMRMAEVERGREACARAAMLARRLGDGDRFARAALAGGYEYVPWVRDEARIAQLEEALVILPPGDGALRTRCMAQLASDRIPEPDTRPLAALARDAVAMARRLDDPETLRATLTAATVLGLYFEPSEAKAMYEEALRLALVAGEKRVALREHGFLAGACLELGDLAGARAHVLAAESLVREFRHGRFQWLPSMLRACLALLEGRFEDAQRSLDQAEASAREDQARGALFAAAPLAVACITERYDERAELESHVRAAFGSLGHALGSCVGEMSIAQLHGRAGDRARAEAQIASVAAQPVFAAIEEPAWLVLLVDACHLVADLELAGRLYRALSPCVHRFAWLGPITACMDLPYARHVGLLAETLGRLDEAIAHLSEAEALASRAGMRAHLARLRYELARLSFARGGHGDHERARELVEDARAIATELGQVGLSSRLDALAPAARSSGPRAARQPRPPSLRREGDYWCVTWDDETVRLEDRRGLAILAQLVESPGQELHVLQLAANGYGQHDAGDAGSVLDRAAVQSYRSRLLDLREDLEEAEQRADTARAENAREEIELLTRELARAVGLGGRERRTGRAAERARTAVQKRVREAIRRIEEELPELGRHLDQTIRTGIFCGYLPEGRRR